MPKSKKLLPQPLWVKTCRECGKPFTPSPSKPGHVDDCRDCAVEVVVTYKAKVAFPSKNSCFAEIEITQDHAAADAFNNAQVRRGGSGVTASCVTRKGHL